MSHSSLLEEESRLRTAIMEIVTVLHKNDISSLHLGGLMRLLGMASEDAQYYDGDEIEINTALAIYAESVADLDHSTHTLH